MWNLIQLGAQTHRAEWWLPGGEEDRKNGENDV